MNEKNTHRLFERFDHLYRGRYLLPTQNLMCDGFCCGDGWFDLIWELSQQIEAYCQQQPEASELIAVQVKQKFGELRFYTHPKLWDVAYLIEAARVRSLQTCELTGAPGRLCKLQPVSSRCGYQTLSAVKATELGYVPTGTGIHPHLPSRSDASSSP